ncbi:MAG: hypothetical protein ACRCZ9_00125 [Fusobacteriaceae bacterium]
MKERKKDNNMVEMITVSTQTIEYDYSYEENDLVHLEMNLIELPFFNKNSKIKKNTSIVYNFNKDKSSYLHIKPGHNLSIPAEKEEKVFYALLKILQKNNHLKNKYCYTDYFEIIKEMELTYSGQERNDIKKSLEVLRGTDYEFQNSFYTKIDGKHQRVSFNELKKIVNIAFITYDKTTSEEERKLFTNNKKEIIRIELSDFIKENIMNKIFLYFSKQNLMSLENAVTRNLWIKLTKWRNGTLFLKVSSKNIATRIPLSWTPSTYSKTIIIIKKALEDLKEKNLVKNYEFVNMMCGKKITNEKSYFEIEFDAVHNEKRNNFSLGRTELDLTQNYDTNIEHIEYKPNVENEFSENRKSYKNSKETENLAENLFNLLDENGMKLSTMKGKIEKALKKNSFEEIKMAILYTNKNAKKSYGKYFTDTLENRWYEEFQQKFIEEQEKIKEKEKKNQQIQQEQKQLSMLEDEKEHLRNATKNSYEKLSEDEKSEIERLALEDYLSQAGAQENMEHLKTFFKNMKKALITSYLVKVDYFNLKNQKKSMIEELEHLIIIEKTVEKKDENLKLDKKTLDRKEIGKILNENIDAAAMIYGIEEDKVLELKFEVAKSAISKVDVTEEYIIKKIDEIIRSW